MSEDQSIYQQSAGEISWKNFLVGFSRSLGAIVVQAVFFIVMTIIIIRLTAPILAPFAALMGGFSNSNNDRSSSPSLLEQFGNPKMFGGAETTPTTR